jgi:hypothetical protein
MRKEGARVESIAGLEGMLEPSGEGRQEDRKEVAVLERFL